jgi:hypothetical protein
MKTYQKIAIISSFVLSSYTGIKSITNAGIAEAKDRTPQLIQQEDILEKKIKDPAYQTLLTKVESELEEHPEYANSLIQKSIESLEKTNTKYDPSTSAAMFQVIKNKIEEKPELTDYLGPKAKYHLLYGELHKCIEEIEHMYTSKKITQRTKKVLDHAMNKAEELFKRLAEDGDKLYKDLAEDIKDFNKKVRKNTEKQDENELEKIIEEGE